MIGNFYVYLYRLSTIPLRIACFIAANIYKSETENEKSKHQIYTYKILLCVTLFLHKLLSIKHILGIVYI